MKSASTSFSSASKNPPAPVDATALWNAIKLLTEPGAIAKLNRSPKFIFFFKDQIAKSLQKYVEVTGADISAPDASGWTLLLDAAASQNLTLCVELLRMKANPSVRTDSGNTVLHSLVRTRN